MIKWPGIRIGNENSAILSYYAEQLRLNLPLTRYELNDARKKVSRYCDQLALAGFELDNSFKL